MVFFYLNQIFVEHSIIKSGDPDETPCSVTSDLGLHFMPLSHKKDAMLM